MKARGFVLAFLAFWAAQRFGLLAPAKVAAVLLLDYVLARPVVDVAFSAAMGFIIFFTLFVFSARSLKAEKSEVRLVRIEKTAEGAAAESEGIKHQMAETRQKVERVEYVLAEIHQKLERIGHAGEERLQAAFESICSTASPAALEFLDAKHRQAVKVLRALLKLDFGGGDPFQNKQKIDVAITTADRNVDRHAVTMFGDKFRDEYNRRTATNMAILRGKLESIAADFRNNKKERVTEAMFEFSSNTLRTAFRMLEDLPSAGAGGGNVRDEIRRLVAENNLSAAVELLPESDDKAMLKARLSELASDGRAGMEAEGLRRRKASITRAVLDLAGGY